MMRKAVTEWEIACSLLQAFEAPDTLDCDQAEAVFLAFLEAERADKDVDAAPEFAALLCHLDKCKGCAELYEQLANDLDDLSGGAKTSPQVPLTPPTFFTPARQGEHVILRLLRPITRRFEMDVPVLQFKPTVAAL